MIAGLVVYVADKNHCPCAANFIYMYKKCYMYSRIGSEIEYKTLVSELHVQSSRLYIV